MDADVRIAAFDWLRGKADEFGDVLPRRELAEGFTFRGTRVPLVGPQGIFKPRVLPAMPLSITTTPRSPYEDSFGADGLLAYRYRGTDPEHRDNVGLRKAMQCQAPLVYFHGIMPGKYLATWPVFVVGDSPETLTFRIAVDDHAVAEEAAARAVGSQKPLSDDATPRRAYITSVARKRLHQRAFRERVLAAYHEQCALCRLRHRELLEAAHIVPDSETGGEPIVQNGIALCALHHAAFDRLIIGIRPDYRVEVRAAVLREKDGPMLRHGLQGIHGSRIVLPRNPQAHPRADLLTRRWQRFQESA